MDVEAVQQAQLLDVGVQEVVAVGDDGVVAFCRLLVDHVIDAVDDVHIVALAADHLVGSGAAVQVVVAYSSYQDV